MGKIATELEAYNIGGSGSYTANKCCTKSRAEELGCVVSGTYEDSQLVQVDDLSGHVEFDMNLTFTMQAYNFNLDEEAEYNLELEYWLSSDNREGEHGSFVAGHYPVYEDNKWKVHFEFTDTLRLAILEGETFRFYFHVLSTDFYYPVQGSGDNVTENAVLTYASDTYSFENVSENYIWTVRSEEIPYIGQTSFVVSA